MTTFRLINKDGISEYELTDNLRLPVEVYGSTRKCEVLGDIQLGSPDWKIILDESFRCFDSTGVLKFTAREYAADDFRNLLIFLGSISPERTCRLMSVEKTGNFLFTFEIEVTRTIEIQKSWSVCYITNGKSLEQINKSAQNLAGQDKIEILVAGPGSISTKIGQNIKLLEFADIGREGRISLKKNLLVSKAKGSNILLLHDRYLVEKVFFDSFEKFGYDYGVVVPHQIFAESKKNYPGLLTFQDGLIKRIENEIVDEKMWINGGCIIAKSKILEKIPLNSFLSWGEAEDIEWANRLLIAGVTPRISKGTVLQTVNTPSGSIESIGLFKPKFDAPDLFSDLSCLSSKGDKVFFDQLISIFNHYELTSVKSNKIRRVFEKSNIWYCKQNNVINMTANRYVFIFCLALLTTIKKNQSNLSIIKYLKISRNVIFQESKRKRHLVMAYLIFRYVLA